MAKYEELMESIITQINDGVWEIGEKLPSLRKQTQISGLSLMTVLNAYQALESQGVIVSHSRSGYVVAPKIIQPAYKRTNPDFEAIEKVDINDIIFDVLQNSRRPNLINFGSVYPDASLYPRAQINRSLANAARTMPASAMIDNFPPGNEDLRHIISQRYAAQGMSVSPDEIVITSGALEGLNLCLQAVTTPGDWVIVESPSFYGSLQSLQKLGLRALSIHTHPQTGIDLKALEVALKSHNVKACWLMTNHQNPMGFTLPDENKQQLSRLLSKHKVYLIEDDVYHELYAGSKKPLPTKAFDHRDMTLHCSSFSKSLVAGFRIGWVAAGAKAEQIQKLQLMSTMAASAPMQLALTNYLTTRSYETHLRLLRKTLAQRKFALWKVLNEHMPKYVKINYSEGGYFIWVELPEHIDARYLYSASLEKNISIAPGAMFSLTKQFQNCFRLNSSFECNEKHIKAIKTLADLIVELNKNAPK
ncbi:PLP-dependent aminotransferase family protein [Shewanella sp. 202IG2-18]|uniref:aminotransferase-like domain-containing protein n=1 Tax=Parashewanella hymeniacidonis TaxID=2807618 RepID=UPI001961FD83|nr:PLP-dependent aminotransferase family protein [Parashewanella hymeniacidonis]MBM7072504.1 PLP-dependent aminotransferase family protein [Parashewanella hymeniacidonis]